MQRVLFSQEHRSQSPLSYVHMVHRARGRELTRLAVARGRDELPHELPLTHSCAL